MPFGLEYTGLRVRDLDAAIDFFTKVLGMALEARVNAHWNNGEFANLVSPNGKHKLELVRGQQPRRWAIPGRRRSRSPGL